MPEFFNRFFKQITMGGLLVFAAITTYVFGVFESGDGDPDWLEPLLEYMKLYLQGLIWWLPVVVLLWLWKFDRDWRDDLRSSLLRKVEDNEKLVAQLWNGFSGQISDGDLDQEIRAVLVQYPSIVLAKDLRIGDKVRQNIDAARFLVERRQYSVDFDDMQVYPKPFYETAVNSIIATNIGSPDRFWGRRDELVEMNRKAIESFPDSPDGSTAIRRVFAIDAGDNINRLEEVMADLQAVGVKIRYLRLALAEQLASDNARSGSEIAGLTDFSVFDTEVGDLKYSGRFDANYRHIVISSHPQTIQDLTNQFNELWEAATPFQGQVDGSVIQRREP